MILAHWHGDELALLHLVKPYRLATMTSTSSDGHLIDYVIRRLGGATSRGSSTRGGISALKGLVRLVKSGHMASMAVDGPKGPYHLVKPGVFELSRLTGAHIVSVGVAVSSAFKFEKSWNKTYLPLPFSKVKIYFGKPWSVVLRSDDPKAEKWAGMLARDLDDANQQASKIIAGL
ncbi:MAG: DUF374 domain-containing protein [Pseudobdellovibrionaceae bacterium]|nr:DUF374 domain-containing protein [Bdellovibrionales bacterium]USN49016.1 MAG: DUF374 domain-containing protein [Pseudobdellovibrionaceae bacterium]